MTHPRATNLRPAPDWGIWPAVLWPVVTALVVGVIGLVMWM